MSSEAINTGNGNHLIFDSLTERLFIGDVDKIRRVTFPEMRIKTMEDTRITVNDWLEAIGLTSVDGGEIVGWDIDHPLDINFEVSLTYDDVVCCMICYKNMPTEIYRGVFNNEEV